MNNLQRMVQYTAQKNVRGFSKAFEAEITNRLANKLAEKRKEVASKLFEMNEPSPVLSPGTPIVMNSRTFGSASGDGEEGQIQSSNVVAGRPDQTTYVVKLNSGKVLQRVKPSEFRVKA